MRLAGSRGCLDYLSYSIAKGLKGATEIFPNCGLRVWCEPRPEAVLDLPAVEEVFWGLPEP